MSKLLFLAVLVLIVSCGWDGEKPVATLTVDGFIGVVKETPSPNQYEVLLSWEPLSDGVAWVIQRQHKDPSPKLVATLEPKVRQYVDSPVTAGETYRYFLGVLDGEEYRVLQEVSLTIPRDLQVTGSEVIERTDGFNRLFFGPEGRLITYGRATVISVNEIISENGAIETFPETQRAGFEKPGRDGGRITIRAKTGRGVLRILARGEKGGTGIQGAPGKTGFTGRDGYHGECVEVPRIHPERGSILGYTIECRSQTGDGVRGGGGYDGNPGNPGMPGGASARIYVQIDDPSRIQIKPYAITGQGGPGGPGGPGGIGGPGGAAGIRNCNECRAAFPGSQGPQGKPGPLGPLGPSGNYEAICLRLGTAVFGDCDKFKD